MHTKRVRADQFSHSIPSRHRLDLLSDQIVGASEFNSPLLQRAFWARSAALSVNTSLDFDLWMQMYTKKPKVPIKTAMGLVERKLTKVQIQHLLAVEKRPAVWEGLMRYNVLRGSTVQLLGQKGLITQRTRLRSPMYTLYRENPSLLQFTEAAALKYNVGSVAVADNVGPVVNWLKDSLEEDVASWEVCLGLIDSFEGSLLELVRTSKALQS